jgi:hypothetical protein
MAQEPYTFTWVAAVVGIVLGVALFGYLGVVVFLSGARNAWWGLTSSGWPKVPAQVVGSEVEERASHGPEGGPNTLYSARLLFVYEVDGRTYTSSRVRFGEALGSGDESEAEMQRLRYPEGAGVSVVYNPRNPAVAAARPAMSPFAPVAPVAGIALLMCAAVIFLGGRLWLADAPVLPLLMRLFVLFFVLMGVVLTTAGAVNLKHAWASAAWPVTSGEIVFQKGDRSESLWTDSGGEEHSGTSHATRLVYAFEVDGRTYYANAWKFGQLAGAGEGWAAEMAARYPPGTAVEVHYHPQDPERAVLEPGVSSEALWLPGAGLAFLLFGLAVWVWIIPAVTEWG